MEFYHKKIENISCLKIQSLWKKYKSNKLENEINYWEKKNFIGAPESIIKIFGELETPRK